MKLKKELEEIINQSILDYIVDKVIEKLIKKNKTALVLFTGATIGFKQSIESLKKLKESGWEFDVAMSKSAEDILTKELIKTSLGVDHIICESDHVDIVELLNKNNLVIIPTLTINSASKIANCISDTLVTNIVSKSMMSGKQIITSINGCCIDNKERQSIYGDNTTTFYKEMLRNNLDRIKKYGILLTTSENLFYKVEKNIIKKFDENKEKSKIELNNSKLNDSEPNNIKVNKIELNKNDVKSFAKINKKVISRSDIYENRNCESIILDKNALVTDLAREEAIKLNIKLLKG